MLRKEENLKIRRWMDPIVPFTEVDHHRDRPKTCGKPFRWANASHRVLLHRRASQTRVQAQAYFVHLPVSSFPKVHITPFDPPFTMGSSETSTAPTAPQMADTKANFKSIFPELVDELLADIRDRFSLPDDAQAYIRRNLEYNVPHGKLNRGLAVFQCYKAFRAGDRITPAEERTAHMLGWCVELLQAFFLVADDIMDDSVTRRGQPCFFRLPEIGLNAINDSLILELMIYRVLRTHFRSSPVYVDLVELFQDITYTTEVGQLLDLTSHEAGKVQLDRFTDDALARIYKYKTSHYTFYLPVALGMRLAGVSDRKCYDTAKQICLKLGHYFQAQDDFLDAFGDPEVTGKVGTDIEENTCTWLVVQTLKVATSEDMAVLADNYGIKNKANSDKVKEVYVKLGIKEIFANFEQESYDESKRMIEEVNNMPVGAFEFLLASIYKRKK